MKETGSGEVISFRRDYDFRDVEEIQPMQPLIKSQKGQSLVEFALVLPVFVVILFGIMEFGRLWEVSNILTSAAREGARVAAVSEPNIEKAKAAAQTVLSAGSITTATITVSGPNSDKDILVTINMAYRPLTGSIIPGLGSFTLSRSTTMRWEG
jgi:Flp pilus assembly protein TadG